MASRAGAPELDATAVRRESPVRKAHAEIARQHGRAAAPGYLGVPLEDAEAIDEPQREEEAEEQAGGGSGSERDRAPRGRTSKARTRESSGADGGSRAGRQGTGSRRRGGGDQPSGSGNGGSPKGSAGTKRAPKGGSGAAKGSSTRRRSTGSKAERAGGSARGARSKAGAKGSAASGRGGGSSRGAGASARGAGAKAASASKRAGGGAKGAASRGSGGGAKPAAAAKRAAGEGANRARSATKGAVGKAGRKVVEKGEEAAADGARAAAGKLRAAVRRGEHAAGDGVGREAGRIVRGMAARAIKRTASSAARRTAEAARNAGSAGVEALAERARKLPIQQSVDVAVPLEVAWEQWMEFRHLPEGASKVTDLRRDGDTLHGRLDGLAQADWEAEITDERPNESFAWRSTEGSDSAGLATFHRLSDRLTRVELNLDVKPVHLLEAATLALHVADRRVDAELRRFKTEAELIDPDSYADLLSGEESD